MTILIIATFFLLEFVGLFFASQNTLTGLMALHQSIRAITQVRDLRQLLVTQQELLQKVKGALSFDDRIVFETASKEIDQIFEYTLDLTRNHSEPYNLIMAAEKTLLHLKAPAWRIVMGKSHFQKDILIINQYTLQLQNQLGQVQLSLAEDSDHIFNRVYKSRFLPLIVGLILSVLFLFFVLWMGIILKNKIERPIQNLVEAAEVLANGNLSIRTQISETNELGVLGEAFNSMAGKLEETTVSRNYLDLANQELEAFSYSISHDLRAPLRAIDGFSKALLEDAGDTLNDVCKSHVNRIITAAKKMNELIDAVLNLSRISRSEMTVTKIDLSAMAHEVADELSKAEPERKVNFKIQDNISVNADNALMRVVLDNLIGNAWKYTSKKTQAQIEFGRYDNQGKIVYFVRDNGVGFDMQYAKKLFTPFQRLHSQSDFPGTGVGLASVKRVIHRHGGRVWAEAVPDEGATFFFTFQAS